MGTVTTLLIGLLAKDWNHPRVLAVGGFLCATAFVLKTLPHAIYGTADFYSREIRNGSDVTVCYPDRPEEDCTGSEAKRNVGPLAILIVAAIIRGVGEAPFYPLGMTYAYVNADSTRAGALAIGTLTRTGKMVVQ